jgi:hypothetical protein
MGSPPPGLPALVKRRSEHRGPDVKVRTESRSLATRDPNATRSRQTKRGKGTQRPKPAGKDNRRPSAGQQRQQRRNSQRPVRPAPPSISRCPRPAGSGPRAREQTLGARRRMLNISCYKNQYLRQLGGVACMVHASKCSHVGHGLINHNRLRHFRKPCEGFHHILPAPEPLFCQP